MSTVNLVMPFDPPMSDWAMRDGSLPVQQISPTGRWPTWQELKEVALSYEDYHVELWTSENDFQIRIASKEMRTFPCDGEFANTISPGLCIAPAQEASIDGKYDSEGVVEFLSFHADLSLELEIVRRLTGTCGPQVMVLGDAAEPWIVESPVSIPIGLTPWNIEVRDRP